MKLINRASVEISTVTPMRNERLCVVDFVRRVDTVLRSLTGDYEIIVVNDGSTDGTGELLDELAAQNSRLRAIHLHRPCGQASAVDVGFQQSNGELVVMLDGDLEQPPEEIPRLIAETRRGFDLVSGWRWNREISCWRRLIPSRVANWLLRAVTGCKARDMGGIKCLRGDVARAMRLRAGQHRLLPALVHIRGGRISEIPVASQPRFAGSSHYGLTRAVNVLLDISYLWFLTASKQRPMYLFGRLGLLMGTITLLLVSTEVAAVFGNGSSFRWPWMLLAAVSAMATLGLWSLGVGWEWTSEARAMARESRDWKVLSLPDKEDESQPIKLERRAA